MKFYKSKFFLVTFVIVLTISLISGILAVMGITAPISNFVATISSPFQFVFQKTSAALHGFSDYFSEFDSLREENQRLRQQLADSQNKILSGEAAMAENEFLRKFLDLPQFSPDVKLMDALVIAENSDNAGVTYTVNKGSLHGVKVGMPVVTGEGLVGKITEVELTCARVLPIIEMNASEGACVERSGAVGICEGTYLLRKDGLCRLSYLPQNADVEEGDRIVTSGYGSVYPAGLVIGTVLDASFDSYARAKVATVSPAVDFSNLTRVMILTDFEIIALTPQAVPEAGEVTDRE